MSEEKADSIALGVMIYALVVYQLRARSIRLRTGAPYDDRLGPVSPFPCILGCLFQVVQRQGVGVERRRIEEEGAGTKGKRDRSRRDGSRSGAGV
jgi:hypothetical protein